MSQNALDRAIEFFGGHVALAKALGCTSQAVSMWKRPGNVVPVKRALQIELLTDGKITGHDLRPDAFRAPDKPKIRPAAKRITA